MTIIDYSNNIDDEIIRWLNSDEEARKTALACSEPKNRLNRSWELLNMIEMRFPGLKVLRENLFRENRKGIYLKVIEDKKHILPPSITQDTFVNNILLKLDRPDQEKISSLYSLKDGYYHIKPGMSAEDKNFLMDTLTKTEYADPRDPDKRIYSAENADIYFDAFELIHYIDLSQKIPPYPVSIPEPHIEGCESRW